MHKNSQNRRMDYARVAPHFGQKRSTAWTGFPPFGQKPPALPCFKRRREAIFCSRSSSGTGGTALPFALTAGLLVSMVTRRARMATSRRSSALPGNKIIFIGVDLAEDVSPILEQDHPLGGVDIRWDFSQGYNHHPAPEGWQPPGRVGQARRKVRVQPGWRWKVCVQSAAG